VKRRGWEKVLCVGEEDQAPDVEGWVYPSESTGRNKPWNSMGVLQELAAPGRGFRDVFLERTCDVRVQVRVGAREVIWVVTRGLNSREWGCLGE